MIFIQVHLSLNVPYLKAYVLEIWKFSLISFLLCLHFVAPPLHSPVHLSTAPAEDVNISIDDPTDQTLLFPSFIQFTPENYAEPQVIRVCADEDAT